MAGLSSIHKLHHAALTKHWTAAWIAVTLNLTNELHCEHESTSQANRRHKRRSALNEIRHSCVTTFTREFVFGKKPVVRHPTARLMTTISALLALLKSDKVVWLRFEPCSKA
jgi:hypothetical protein